MPSVKTERKNDCHASNVLLIGGRPKAAQEHWFGGRPKAAFIALVWRPKAAKDLAALT